MKEVVLAYPEELEKAIQLPPEQAAAEIGLMAALKMLELGRLGFREAAQLAGLQESEFMEVAARYRQPEPALPPEAVPPAPGPSGRTPCGARDEGSGAPAVPSRSGWRRALGVFAADPLMREIVEAGRKIREAERPKK